MQWAYCVTTVPQRKDDLLPRTLRSLAAAGFDKPRLCVDANTGIAKSSLLDVTRAYAEAFPELELTVRYPNIRTYGNWVLSLAELYLYNPGADRFLVAQDDFVTYRNLRQYLEKCPYPERGYWNLYTMPSNQTLAPDGTGWYLSNQFGRGAVALVFNRETVLTLLTHQHMVERPMDAHRGWKAVDGGVVTALAKAGWKEFCHNPSLTQHVGLVSSMGNKPHRLAESFRGEEFNALDLLAVNSHDAASERK